MNKIQDPFPKLEPVWKKDADGKEYFDEAASRRNFALHKKFMKWAVEAYTKAMDGPKKR